MAVNWCSGCNGDGYTDQLFRKKKCPVCHADEKHAFKNAFGKIIGYVQPPGTRPSPPPAPPAPPHTRRKGAGSIR